MNFEDIRKLVEDVEKHEKCIRSIENIILNYCDHEESNEFLKLAIESLEKEIDKIKSSIGIKK